MSTEKYIKANPDFRDIDTEEDGLRLLEFVKTEISKEAVQTLILDISECYLDYWGCAPLIEGCIDAISSPNSGMKNLSILTTMEFGSRDSYASLFFKGTKHEANSASKDFNRIAYEACQLSSLEFRIWVVPQKYTYAGLDALKGAKVTLSSM